MNNKNIRVLHVLNELKPSGAESMLRAAYAEFTKQNVECEILSTGEQIGQYASQLHHAGYIIHHIPYARSPLFFLKIFWLMKNGYDSIHLHTQRGNFWFGLIARLAVRGNVIRTIHSSFTFDGLIKIRTMWSRRILQFLGVRHVAIGDSVFRVESERFGIKPTIISNWYDSSHFIPPISEERKAARRAIGISDEVLVIVSVGNCASVKNHTSLIKALSLLPKEKRPLYLHVGHEGENFSERQLAVQEGLVEDIIFMGAMSDVRNALYAADVFIMPSLLEGFGIAAIEALGCGLPAIFTNVHGLKDFRKYYLNLIYCGTTAEELAKSIQQVIEMSKEDRDFLSRNNAEISRENFGMPQGVVGYVTLYREDARNK